MSHPAGLLLYGANNRDRTGDLVLTKDVLYQLSYVGTGLQLRDKTQKTKRALKVCRNPRMSTDRKKKNEKISTTDTDPAEDGSEHIQISIKPTM